VEVDATFYSIPAAATLRGWYQKTPDDFRFCLKMPRRITHELPMHESGADLHHFLQHAALLGEKLGMILVQFPGAFRGDHHYRELRRFLPQLSPEFNYAIEFRHPSWNQPRFSELLREHDIARVWTDAGAHGGFAAYQHCEKTSDSLYLRLLGDSASRYDEHGNRLHRYHRLLWPRDSELDAWVERLRSTPLAHTAYIFANNHFEGFAPATLERVRQRISLPERNLDWNAATHTHEQTNQRELWDATVTKNVPQTDECA
jgi:uncharacterized protein YecE (DUF72 family)